ncbi:MAG TPA: AAA family ATPase [Syntrophobacteraceae bacterium]|nr:AAA family ATPase [Syntrophobacteraceae bacterium]
MYLSRVQIKNFRNFADLDVSLDANIVIVGENRVGKSNFIFALRLVLDNSLPDSARQLKLSDVWDGYDGSASDDGPQIEIHLDFTDFDDDDDLTALLTDYRLADDHTIARLSYVFRKKDGVEGCPISEADFDFKVFGGADETRAVSPQVRRRICLDVLHALRDAESDLSTWRNSPLRPLLEDAISQVPEEDLTAVSKAMNKATTQMAKLDPIRELEDELRKRMAELAGANQDLDAKLAFAPTDPLRLFRAIRVFIDGGKRGISEASLGSANLALLTLKLAEFEWRRQKNERNFTLVAVEEPEAHLHPHLQRKVFSSLFEENEQDGQSLILSTHSPNIASVVPLGSIVLLKDEGSRGTRAYSLANLSLKGEDLEDLQRYLDVTRAEVLFSRGVIFVEGDAEAALLPVFAPSLGHDLDQLGITICNVCGTNFTPYVRLAAALSLPFSVVTDWDPRADGKKAYGWNRSLKLIRAIRDARTDEPLPPRRAQRLRDEERHLRITAERHGIFLNGDTLETEIARTPSLVEPLLNVLREQEFGLRLTERIDEWLEDNSKIDNSQLMLMIGYVSKGRFAERLTEMASGLEPPKYIKLAIEHVVNNG